MARFVATWVDVALDQYLALSAHQQSLIDHRISELVDSPDGPECRYEPHSDTWTAMDAEAAGLIVYTFRAEGLRLIVLRLVYF